MTGFPFGFERQRRQTLLCNAQFCKSNPCSWLKFLLDLTGGHASVGEQTTIVDNAQMIRKAPPTAEFRASPLPCRP
jgi:hypothetical protein